MIELLNIMLKSNYHLNRNVDVIEQGNVLLGRYYSNTGDVIDEFKISK
jgi:hypothetical protein